MNQILFNKMLANALMVLAGNDGGGLTPLYVVDKYPHIYGKSQGKLIVDISPGERVSMTQKEFDALPETAAPDNADYLKKAVGRVRSAMAGVDPETANQILEPILNEIRTADLQKAATDLRRAIASVPKAQAEEILAPLLGQVKAKKTA